MNIFGVWLLTYELWVILGIILIILEVTLDGSFVVFLPLGVASMINGLLMAMQKHAVLKMDILIEHWGHSLVSYGLLALAASTIMRLLKRRLKTEDNPDVNDY